MRVFGILITDELTLQVYDELAYHHIKNSQSIEIEEDSTDDISSSTVQPQIKSGRSTES